MSELLPDAPFDVAALVSTAAALRWARDLDARMVRDARWYEKRAAIRSAFARAIAGRQGRRLHLVDR